jgi:hypothetical protein
MVKRFSNLFALLFVLIFDFFFFAFYFFSTSLFHLVHLNANVATSVHSFVVLIEIVNKIKKNLEQKAFIISKQQNVNKKKKKEKKSSFGSF